MTLEDWLVRKSPGLLCTELSILSDRKIHLLTAAFLRGVWNWLPSHHTQIAVEATEKLADGRLSAHELARLRTTDTLETAEPLWLCGESPWYAAMPEWERELNGDAYERSMIESEKRIAAFGYIQSRTRAGVDWPHWVAAKAAVLARELCQSNPTSRDELEEARYQFAAFCDVAGAGWHAAPRWPEWRTDAVCGVARTIYRNRAFHDLPILADALQDAGCDDDVVLRHCREFREHVRGCWVLDLAMGIS